MGLVAGCLAAGSGLISRVSKWFDEKASEGKEACAFNFKFHIHRTFSERKKVHVLDEQG